MKIRRFSAFLLRLTLGLGIALGAPAYALDKPKDQGIGGTGVMGVLGGSGPLLLNGFILPNVAAVPVQNDNGIGGTGLKPGLVVKVIGSETDNGLIAKSIVVEHEVIGPVDAVDEAQHLITILGQQIDVSRSSSSHVKLNQWLAVSGLRDGQGIIHASLLETSKPGAFKIIGNQSEIDNFTAVRGSVILKAHPIKGRMVVTGNKNGKAFAIKSVRPWSYFGGATTLAKISLEGYLNLAEGQDIDIASDEIRADANPESVADSDQPIIVTATGRGGQIFKVETISSAAKSSSSGENSSGSTSTSQTKETESETKSGSETSGSESKEKSGKTESSGGSSGKTDGKSGSKSQKSEKSN